MRNICIILLGSALLALATPANAQDDKRIHINFGGGPTIPTGPIGDRFETGWGPAIGVTIDTPSKRFGLPVRVRLSLDGHRRGRAARKPAPGRQQLLGQPPDPSARLQSHREPDARRRARPRLRRARPRRLLPQGRDHPVRRQRHHLRSLLVCVRDLSDRERARLARRLGPGLQRRRRRRLQDRRERRVLRRVALPLRLGSQRSSRWPRRWAPRPAAAPTAPTGRSRSASVSNRGASPLGLPCTRPRSPLRRLAPGAWLARGARSRGRGFAPRTPPHAPSLAAPPASRRARGSLAALAALPGLRAAGASAPRISSHDHRGIPAGAGSCVPVQ